MIEALSMTREFDGTITIEYAPQWIGIETEFLGHIVLGGFRWAKFNQQTKVLTFTANNGIFKYKLRKPEPFTLLKLLIHF